MLGKLSVECCKVFVKLSDLGVSAFDIVFGFLDVLLHLFYGSP